MDSQVETPIVWLTFAGIIIIPLSIVLIWWRYKKYHQFGTSKHVEDLQGFLSQKDKDNEYLRRKIETQAREQAVESTRLRQNLERMNSDNERMKKSIQKLKESLKRAEHDKDVAIKRLSKAIGDRLVQNNPNLADLSDDFRPTKLADISNELYDNEWTSAYSCMNDAGISDNDCVKLLLYIIMKAHQFCHSEIHEGISALVNKDKELTTTTKNQIKKKSDFIRPSRFDMFNKAFCKELHEKKPELLTLEDLSVYTEHCFNLCWYMALQDPPMIFRYTPGTGSDEPESQGQILSRDFYREYTRRGAYIEYIVWPIMLLHENGPLISKGVAEGYN